MLSTTVEQEILEKVRSLSLDKQQTILDFAVFEEVIESWVRESLERPE